MLILRGLFYKAWCIFEGLVVCEHGHVSVVHSVFACACISS